MNLFEIILTNAVEGCDFEMLTKQDIENLFKNECYIVLERIKSILEDDGLDDKECFEKIEKIVCLFEEIGSDCGTRHDFG